MSSNQARADQVKALPHSAEASSKRSNSPRVARSRNRTPATPNDRKIECELPSSLPLTTTELDVLERYIGAEIDKLLKR